MENNEKKDKYKDYLPQNRQKNSSLEPIRIISSILVCLLVIGLIAIAGIYFATGRNVVEESLTINSRSYNMNIGETIALSNVYTSPNVVWETANDNIEIKNGEVTALSEGSAYVIAVEDNKQVSDVLITVLPADSRLSIDNHDIRISTNENYKINITYNNTLDNNGLNKQKNTKDNEYNKYSDIEIEEEETVSSEDDSEIKRLENELLQDIQEESEELEIVEDKSNENITIKELEVKEDDTVEEPNITFKSSDENIVKVDGANITAVSEGNATITVTSDEGDVDYTNVTVKREPITIFETTYNVENQSEVQINYELKDANSSVEWKSDNSKIATVNTSGKVKGESEGTTTITAKVDGVEKRINIIVTNKIINPTSIILNPTNTITIYNGETASISATVNPNNATNKTITWKSSDTSKVTVDKNGKIIAKSKGSATITATAGTVTSEIKVKVLQKIESISITTPSNDNISYNKGDTITIKYSILPNNATIESGDIIVNSNSDYLKLESDDSKNKTLKFKIIKEDSNKKIKVAITIKSKKHNKSATRTIIINAQKKATTTKTKENSIKNAIAWMVLVGENPYVGYDINRRNSIKGINIKTYNGPDKKYVDCSSFVYYGLTNKDAGNFTKLKEKVKNAFTTADMPKALVAAGFKAFCRKNYNGNSFNKKSDFEKADLSLSKLEHGDILWRPKKKGFSHGHTEVFIKKNGKYYKLGAHGKENISFKNQVSLKSLTKEKLKEFDCYFRYP